jgi:hypothetical protein
MRKFLTSGRRRYALLLLVVGAGSLAIMGNSCAPTKQPAPPATGLSISPAIGDFSSQTINPSQPYGPIRFTVTNNGPDDSGALTVSGLSAPFAVAGSSTCGPSLAAGDTCVVDVTFNPTAASGYLQTLKVSDGSSATATVAGVGTL